ncbi:hypothetical protein SISNIDRAFT_448024 [Sistotremastrum niveocremeum HHB9708]|uniref:Enhancer of mRNA-decapping protein 4 WD40 repeat region domain-containing protein n=2 Tax=Sistotremastraceae TaxID=3402574 RepID=A0A165AKJ0_9AGAM|nr:hypothetical protein SISNIDRAFT_448024 [Sistotremastrum niveocremeum HHB9708]KZT41991.1 hypothetical protein SISSUDRAFT_1041916 [Sistotremastrum suecicum HHB10207 ss-3]
MDTLTKNQMSVLAQVPTPESSSSYQEIPQRQAQDAPRPQPIPPTQRLPSPPIRASSPPRNYGRPPQRAGSPPQRAVSGAREQPQPQKDNTARVAAPQPAWRGPPEVKPKATPTKPVVPAKSSSQPQTIIFDVSLPLENIQAAPDSSVSTPIALVKVEPTFLPGSTIGATTWIAYAMTKGRVRVISRASGDRTLLQLPNVFPSTTSVVDMAVFGNRLAGVTSDGGFVVWELPPVITDDVPGRLLLCVVPPPEAEALKSVRWHPKQPDTVAVASEARIYLININEAPRRFGADPVAQNDLASIGNIINLTKPLVAFAFDVPHFAIATISEDSTLELWQISNQLPFWSSRVDGEGVPSSIDFLDGGIVVGRKNGTIFQLLSVMSENILSTIKFVNGSARDDREMFGHVAYDSRIQTLWVANSRRESLIALKVCFEMATPSPGGADQVRGGYFEQVVEFVGPKPSIHFVILTDDLDPRAEEAHAACIAAKVNPGPLAMVAFSVHSSGVDQILIRKEWFENALDNSLAKFPTYNAPPIQPVMPAPRIAQVNFGSNPLPIPPTQAPVIASNPRVRSPPSEEVEVDNGRDEGRPSDVKAKSLKGKGVAAKDKDDNNSGKDKDKGKAADPAVVTESPLGSALLKEIRRVEESLHTRIGRLVGKELDKQQQRLEEARVADQTADFARQETILKLISTELTKNTTRVVEMAVKSEIQASVLPALETITKNEIKNALNGQISKGLTDSMKQTLPTEIERLLLRPDVSTHVARTFTSTVTPLIERHVKEGITKTLIPQYAAESSAMHQDLSREIRAEILNLKKEVITWQSEALRGQESVIRDMEQSIRALSEQIKFLSLNIPVPPVGPPVQGPPQHIHQHRGSPVHSSSPHGQIGGSHMRSANIPPPPNYSNPQTAFQQPQPINPPWFQQGLLQQSLPPPPPPPQPQQQQAPPPPSEDWDETYLGVLGTQDPRQLRDLLSRSNPEVIMPLNGNGPLSQAVVLTLVHRLAAAVGETSPVEESFKSSLWWLQRAATTLNTNDPLISPYTARVLPNVQAMLNTTKSRLGLLPGGPPLMEANRMIAEIQEIIGRKPL